MSCGVVHRHGLDPALLRPSCRPVATAPIRLLAWEPSYAAGAALKRPKKKELHFHIHTSETKVHGVKAGHWNLLKLLHDCDVRAK